MTSLHSLGFKLYTICIIFLNYIAFMVLVYLTPHVQLYTSVFIPQNILNIQSIILYIVFMKD